MYAQPVPLAGDVEELAEGECPLSAATISALLPVGAPGERSVAGAQQGCVRLGRGFP